MSIHRLIEEIKAAGLDVYGPERLTSYVYFTDDVRIGYAQVDHMAGAGFSTVHKPNRQTGTGFSAESIEEALSFAPGWATSSDRLRVNKFKDFSEFAAKHWQPLVQY